jgi:hypothetical protein
MQIYCDFLRLERNNFLGLFFIPLPGESKMAGVEKRAQMEEDDDDPLDHMMATITDGVEDEDEDEDEGAASSDEDSSDSEGEIGEEELASYRARVESNPQQYEAHVQLIAALRSLDGKEDALRQARYPAALLV